MAVVGGDDSGGGSDAACAWMGDSMAVNFFQGLALWACSGLYIAGILSRR
jgi:hypothetical protein